MRDPRLPERAPRGKQFAVSRQSHVAGGPSQPTDILLHQRYDSGHAAELLAESIDWRLMPLVVLVEKGRP